jgi:hypothetical protein
MTLLQENAMDDKPPNHPIEDAIAKFIPQRSRNSGVSPFTQAVEDARSIEVMLEHIDADYKRLGENIAKLHELYTDQNKMLNAVSNTVIDILKITGNK